MPKNDGLTPRKRSNCVVGKYSMPTHNQNIVVNLVCEEKIAFFSIFNRNIYRAFCKTKTLCQMHKMRLFPEYLCKLFRINLKWQLRLCRNRIRRIFLHIKTGVYTT